MEIPGLYYFPNVVSDEFGKEILEFLKASKDWFPVGGAARLRGFVENHQNIKKSREVIH